MRARSPAAHRLVTRAVRHRQRLRRYWRRLYPELLPWQIDVLEHSYFRGRPAVDVLERSYYRRLEARLHKVHTRFTCAGASSGPIKGLTCTDTLWMGFRVSGQ